MLFIIREVDRDRDCTRELGRGPIPVSMGRKASPGACNYLVLHRGNAREGRAAHHVVCGEAVGEVED